MQKEVKFYAYQIVDAPASSPYSSLRSLIGTFKAPKNLLNKPDRLMALARSKFKKIKAISLSTSPLPKKLYDDPFHLNLYNIKGIAPSYAQAEAGNG